MIDALARYEVHQSTAALGGRRRGLGRTKSTASQVTYPYFLVKGALAQYVKLWK